MASSFLPSYRRMVTRLSQVGEGAGPGPGVGAHYGHHITTCPPDFQTLRQPFVRSYNRIPERNQMVKVLVLLLIEPDKTQFNGNITLSILESSTFLLDNRVYEPVLPLRLLLDKRYYYIFFTIFLLQKCFKSILFIDKPIFQVSHFLCITLQVRLFTLLSDLLFALTGKPLQHFLSC